LITLHMDVKRARQRQARYEARQQSDCINRQMGDPWISVGLFIAIGSLCMSPLVVVSLALEPLQ